MSNKFTILGIRDFLKRTRERKNARGFTLIELMVTFSIYVIISTVVISNYRDYSRNAVSANAPEDVVLALRQAQVFGAAGKGNATLCGGSTSLFDCRYGVFFTANAGSENGFIIFADVNDNKRYDTGEEIETTTWKDSSVITNVECLPAVATPSCSLGVLNITFRRPSPDALINDTAGGGYSFGKITVSNGIVGAGAKSSVVTISQAGQISTQ